MRNLLIVICILFSALSLFFSLPRSSELRNLHSSAASVIAIIDSNKVIGESLVLQDVEQQLKEQNSRLQQEFEKEMEKFKLSKEELDLLSEEAQKVKREQHDKEILQVRDHYTKKAAGLERSYRNAVNNIFNKVKEVVKQIAESEKVNLVLEQDRVLYLQNKIDLSDTVLQSMNKVMPKFTLKTIE